jgi:hypothetical protein
MKHLLLPAFLFSVLLNSAQPFNSDTISVNNISARFFSNGMVSYGGNAGQFSTTSDAHFFVPKDSGVQALFGGSLWVGGYDDVFGVLHMSSVRYDDSLTNFRPGPIASSYSGNYEQRYNHVWKVSRQQIDYHQQHFNDVGYVAPADLTNWPCNGNTANGEPGILAPFVDLNSNGVYEPQSGEYPDVLGDEALYIIYSDHANVNNTNYGNKLQVDVHLMVYGYQSSSAALNNSLFVHYAVVNRSNDGYNDLLLGSWNDFDLGSFANDRVGCDTTLNSFFVYNGYLPDLDLQGSKGYGTMRASFGVKFLNRKLTSFAYFTNGATFAQTDPSTPHQHYNYMDGFWADGTPYSTGGTGYNTGVPTKYIFPSIPCDSSGWSDQTSGQPAGDRRALGSTGKYNLPAGGSICLDMAYVFATGSAQATCIADGVDSLAARMQEVQTFYNSSAASCYDLALELPAIKEEEAVLYPNPATDKVTLKLPEDGVYSVQLSDINGKVVLSKASVSSVYTFNTSHLAPGVYMLIAENRDRRITGKVVIQK